MNSSDYRMVLLIMGDEKTKKKQLVKEWFSEAKKLNDKAEMKEIQDPLYCSYTSVFFPLKFEEGTLQMEIPVELRVLRSNQLGANSRHSKPFFSGAHGAFVVVNADTKQTIEHGEDWRRKIEQSVSFPTHCPLPVFLLVNGEGGGEDWKDYEERNQINKVFELEKEVSRFNPFLEMVQLVMGFKEIREKFIKQAGQKVEVITEGSIPKSEKGNCSIN